jgi:hypothetical protein
MTAGRRRASRAKPAGELSGIDILGRYGFATWAGFSGFRGLILIANLSLTEQRRDTSNHRRS